MLFKSLALKNFKCFEEVEVEFAPITLLTGANSSGKSSLIYSLLAMLQTEQFPLYLSPNGKYVDMGSFKEMVFRGDIFSKLEISLATKTPHEIEFFNQNGLFTSSWSLDRKNSLALLNHFDVTLNSGNYRLLRHALEAYRFDYIVNDIDNSALYNMGLASIINDPHFSKARNASQLDKKISFKKVEFENLKQLSNSLMNIPDVNALLSESILEHIVGTLENIESNFNYLGSFRLPPERTYYQKAKAQEKLGVNGEGYIDQIIEWEETDPVKFKELNEIMAELELIQSIQSEKMKGGRFELTVKAKENSSSASLTDVGFGISQFLPLIVADLQLPNTSCLALSQPEIHLHPKIQALFGNYLAKQVNKSGKQYIVETHSEYLLNRIRLLLVKGELKPENVRVYYFENDGIKSVIHNVEFTTDGQIKGAPDGFFDTYGMDVMDIALNA